MAVVTSDPLALGRAFDGLNDAVRGFRNYYLHAAAGMTIARQLQWLDGQVEQLGHRHLGEELVRGATWLARERCTGRRPSRVTVTPPGAYPESPGAPPPPAVASGEGAPVSAAATSGPAVPVRVDDEDTGIYLADGRLFVLRHGVYLKADGGWLVARRNDRELSRFPIADLDIVIVHGHGISLSAHLASTLADHRVVAAILPNAGEDIAILNPVTQTRAPRRAAQVLRRHEPEIVAAGVAMVSTKVSNQASTLRYFGKHRKSAEPALYQALTDGAHEIREAAARLRDTPVVPGEDLRATIMGIEGQAAAVYWPLVQRLVPDHLGFTHRHTFGAADIVNQCLNYVYGILYAEVWRAVVGAGLDPYFGIVHGSKRDQGSLVFDLIEELRSPFCDRLVLALLGRRFSPAMGRDGLLRTSTRRSLAAAFRRRWSKPVAWRGQRRAPATILDGQAQALARLFDGKAGSYSGFLMPW